MPVAAAPPAPYVAPAAVVYGRIDVRVARGTRLVVAELDGRARRAVRVPDGTRRVSVPLPTGRWGLSVRAVGTTGTRRTASRVVWVLPASGARAGTTEGRLDRVLQRRMNQLSASTRVANGIYVQNLITGCGAGVNAGAVFPAASTLKAAVLLEAVRHPAGASADLLDRMILDSGNVAAGHVLTIQGGGDGVRGAARVTATMQALGMRQSLVRRPYAIGYERIPVERNIAPELYTNYISTPYELAMLMVALHRASLGKGRVARMGVDALRARREITRRLLDVRDRSKIVAGVSPQWPVAHKTGYTDEVKADAGIVYTPRGPIVVSVMEWSNSGASDAFISRVAGRAVKYLSRGGRCS